MGNRQKAVVCAPDKHENVFGIRNKAGVPIFFAGKMGAKVLRL